MWMFESWKHNRKKVCSAIDSSGLHLSCNIYSNILKGKDPPTNNTFAVHISSVVSTTIDLASQARFIFLNYLQTIDWLEKCETIESRTVCDWNKSGINDSVFLETMQLKWILSERNMHRSNSNRTASAHLPDCNRTICTVIDIVSNLFYNSDSVHLSFSHENNVPFRVPKTR